MASGGDDISNTDASASDRRQSEYREMVMSSMLNLMNHPSVDGLVFGVVGKDLKCFSGATGNLAQWWMDEVGFERDAPEIVEKTTQIEAQIAQESVNEGKPPETVVALQEINNAALDSLLSILMTHCNPPQKKFPFDKGIPPPWWPSGKEEWWPQLEVEDNDDDGQRLPTALPPPPYKSPQDLLKKWKAPVLIAVIKHMAHDMPKVRSLVTETNNLWKKLTREERSILVAVLVTEEEVALAAASASASEGRHPPQLLGQASGGVVMDGVRGRGGTRKRKLAPGSSSSS